jgi:hypothetical protein
LITRGDTVSCQQVRDDECCGIGIGERIVGAYHRDAVALAEIAEPVAQLPVGVEPAREVERAHPRHAGKRCAAAAGGFLEESEIEGKVVSREDRTVESPSQFDDHGVDSWGAPELAMGDAVNVLGAESAEVAPPWPDVAGPTVEDMSLRIDDDDRDLENAVSSRRETGGLDVDDCEAHVGSRHTPHCRHGVSH